MITRESQEACRAVRGSAGDLGAGVGGRGGGREETEQFRLSLEGVEFGMGRKLRSGRANECPE